MGWAVGAGLDHADHYLAARVTGSGDVVLLAGDDPLVAVKDRLGRDVLGVGGSEAGLGHPEAGADLPVEQRFEPLFLLFWGADSLDDLHVAGVRSAAIEGLGGQPAPAQFGSYVGVVQVGEALPCLVIGEEEVPQALVAGLGLQAVEEF